MAKGKKTGGRAFAPGNQVAKGKGRPPMPPDLKAAKRLTNTEFMALVTRFLTMDRGELQRVIQDPKTPMLEVMVGSIVAKAASASDHTRLDFLITRVLGKVPDQLQVSARPQMIIHKPDGSRVELTQKGEEELELLPAGDEDDEPT